MNENKLWRNSYLNRKMRELEIFRDIIKIELIIDMWIYSNHLYL